jgi:NTE family protein
MNQFSLINKFNWQWHFMLQLHDLGRKSAETWLKNNFDHLGKKPTIDFGEFLGSDTQTT